MRRASCEAIGMLCKIEGDKLTSELIKSLISIIPKTKDINAKCGCIFALGCIKRYLGGMRSIAYLPNIFGIMKDSFDLLNSPILNIWLLHSLKLTIEAAGNFILFFNKFFFKNVRSKFFFICTINIIFY